MPKDTMDRLTVSIGQFSAAGHKPDNQDFYGARVPDAALLTHKGIVLAVADGISSSAISREAAELSVKAMLSDYYDTSEAASVRSAGRAVLQATSAWLHGQNSALGDMNAGRVCTLSALVLKGRQAHVLHVGDSRVSRLVARALEPLTADHRKVLSPQESYLARAMGLEPVLDVDYRALPLSVGDVYVLSTDGVHEHILSRTLTDALIKHPGDLDRVAQMLAEAALAAGSRDNLTVQVVRVEHLPEAGGMQDDPDGALALLPLPPLPQPGGRLDGFTIQRQIHATARSHVFRARDATGRAVALKIPTAEMAQDAAYLRRFVLEEWIARRLSSPHVLSAPAQQGGRSALYVVTDFVEGQTLRQWMTDHPRATLAQMRDIIGQLVQGLRAFHRRDMIHQDIRPENILIDADGTVKIIDFGSTFVAGVEEAAPGTLPEMPGTFQYTAPEYLAGDAASWRSDQFALAVIAYEMLTGRLPYGAQVARITTRGDLRRLSYDPARAEDNALPHWIDGALKRALSPDPLNRYNALSEFMMDLTRPGAGLDPTARRPLVQRDPLRFWQGLCLCLAVLCLILTVRLLHP